MKNKLFALLTVLVLVGLIACDPKVDRKLWDYSVVFDSNTDADEIEILVQTIHHGELAEEPEDPKYEDKIFAGWYTTVDCQDGTKFDFDTSITGDITLYAKWWEPYLEFYSDASFSITPNYYEYYRPKYNPCWEGDLMYSKDTETWSTFSKTAGNIATAATSEIGDDGKYHLYVRGKGNTIITKGNRWNFQNDGVTKLYCSGNIMTLLDFENPSDSEMGNECFSNMFGGCSRLANAPELPATKLSPSCYYCLFNWCTSLTEAPYLPATILDESCYSYMFQYCESLNKAPVLPAMTLALRCYENMFENSGIIQAPYLPALSLSDRCYQSMFTGCKKLTTVSILPATTLSYGCYNTMFSDCSALETIPEGMLPAKKMAEECYVGMFRSSGLKSVPVNLLPSENLAKNCYGLVSQYDSFGMFYNCESLTNAPLLPATTLKEGCYMGMFENCTSLKDLPEDMIAAKTLAKGCCQEMFDNCPALEEAPTLKATELVDDCYKWMFWNCTKLSHLEVNFTLWNGTYEWVGSVGATGTFVCPSDLSIQYDDSHVPSGWTVVQN